MNSELQHLRWQIDGVVDLMVLMLGCGAQDPEMVGNSYGGSVRYLGSTFKLLLSLFFFIIFVHYLLSDDNF